MRPLPRPTGCASGSTAEDDYSQRPAYPDPEIKLRQPRRGDPADEGPPPGRHRGLPATSTRRSRAAITEGYRVLEELGATDELRGELTPLGDQLGRLPVDPRLGRMILGGRDGGALREVVVIAAALGLQDPRERPQAAQQRADEAHRKFRDEGSDFASYSSKLWERLAGRSKAQRAARAASCTGCVATASCPTTGCGSGRMSTTSSWRVMRDLGFTPNSQPASAESRSTARCYPGCSSKIGMWNPETRVYVGARQTRFLIHPSSGLARKPPAWVMAAELRRDLSAVRPDRRPARPPRGSRPRRAPLCRRSYGTPHWEQKPAQVMCKEHVTVYGLPIVKDRSVAFARYDQPMCREVFITHALVRHEYATKGAFMEHNRRLHDEVRRLRDKARHSDMLADEYQLAQFFDQRIPPTVYSGKTFEAWRADAEARDPAVLYLSHLRTSCSTRPTSCRPSTTPISSWSAARPCSSPTGSIPARTTTASPSPCRSRCCPSSIPP